MHLDYKLTTLDNGLRVATSHMPQVDSIAMGVWVGVGGRYESVRLSGISHFIEHLLFKGTKTRSARSISEAIEGRGGYFNAFTAEEMTCYYARIGSRNRKNVFEILADMYLNPLFGAADIDRERGVIIEEIMMYRDQPQHMVQEMLGEMIWVKHALGRPLIGTPANILRISRDDILDFKEKKYVPKNTVISMAGCVDHDECVEQVAHLLSDLSPGKAPVCRAVTAATKQERIRVSTRDIEQSHLALGVRLFGRRDRRRYALKLLSVILGENMSSRLFQVVREKNGLAYAIHSSAHLANETGAFVISAGLDRKRSDKALRLIVNELSKMKDKAVGQKALRRAKDYAIGQMSIGLESTTTQMSWLGERLVNYGRLMQPEEHVRSLEQVTAEDVRKLAAQILRADKLSVAMITPEKDALSMSTIENIISLL